MRKVSEKLDALFPSIFMPYLMLEYLNNHSSIIEKTKKFLKILDGFFRCDILYSIIEYLNKYSIILEKR